MDFGATPCNAALPQTGVGHVSPSTQDGRMPLLSVMRRLLTLACDGYGSTTHDASLWWRRRRRWRWRRVLPRLLFVGGGLILRLRPGTSYVNHKNYQAISHTGQAITCSRWADRKSWSTERFWERDREGSCLRCRRGWADFAWLVEGAIRFPDDDRTKWGSMLLATDAQDESPG